jgi:methylated-DNA-protein-cysteine methyltransferase related protein
MAAIPDGMDLPWHRVVNSKGEISRRDHPTGQDEQRARLEREGVRFGRGGRISMERYGWVPRS